MIIAQAISVDNLIASVYNLAMKVSALGEFGLIASMTKLLRRGSPDLLLGPGDDAAVWRPRSGYELATTDILLEGVHFTLDVASWYEIGWKALAANISDVAAMGGVPRYALLSIGLHPSTDVESVEDLYRGATAVCDRFDTAIIGGDTVRSPRILVVSPTLIGEAVVVDGHVRLLRRDRAMVGDTLAVTGPLGASRAGLEMILQRHKVEPSLAEKLRRAHMQPLPRVPEAQVLLACGVEAAMDVSDGLVGDLQKLCSASGVAAVIDLPMIPVSDDATVAFPGRALDFALYGGEDYELLFAAPKAVFDDVQRRLCNAGLASVAAVGQIVSGPVGNVNLRDGGGNETPARRGGYDAFGRNSQKNRGPDVG